MPPPWEGGPQGMGPHRAWGRRGSAVITRTASRPGCTADPTTATATAARRPGSRGDASADRRACASWTRWLRHPALHRERGGRGRRRRSAPRVTARAAGGRDGSRPPRGRSGRRAPHAGRADRSGDGDRAGLPRRAARGDRHGARALHEDSGPSWRDCSPSWPTAGRADANRGRVTVVATCEAADQPEVRLDCRPCHSSGGSAAPAPPPLV